MKKMHWTHLVAGAVMLMAVALAGCTVPGDGELVKMEDTKFVPAELEVERGTEVVWRNQDPFAHNVMAKDGSFGSEDEMAEGDTFRYTFDAPGTFEYECTIHPGMEGTVTVTGAGGNMPEGNDTDDTA